MILFTKPLRRAGVGSGSVRAAASMEAAAASDAFELSYMVHMTALMIPATLHTLSS